MKDCLFCKIASGEFASATIFDNHEFRVILDKFPSGKGHVLILTKEHFDDIYDMDADTAGKLFALATEVARALKNVLHCDGLNVLQNNGAAAGQTVMHFHLHLIPRFDGDPLDFHWPTQAFSDEVLMELAEKIGREI